MGYCAAQDQAGSTPPAGAGYQPGWSYYPQAERPPSPPGRSRLGMWIGIGAAVVVIAVACGLIFGVFKDDIFGSGGGGGSGGGASSPEQAVREFISAYDNRDVDAIFALIDPASISTLLQGQSEDLAKQMLKAAMFGQQSFKFSGIELSTKQTSDTTATVTITAGKLTVTKPDGQEETSDVSEADQPPTVGLVKRDGSWYIDASAIGLFISPASGSGGGSVEVAPA